MANKLKQTAFLTARKLCPTILPFRIGVLAQIERFRSARVSGNKKPANVVQNSVETISPAHLPMKEAVRAQLRVFVAAKTRRANAKVRAKTERVSSVASSLPDRTAVLAQISALRGDKASQIMRCEASKIRLQTRLV